LALAHCTLYRLLGQCPALGGTGSCRVTPRGERGKGGTTRDLDSPVAAKSDRLAGFPRQQVKPVDIEIPKGTSGRVKVSTTRPVRKQSVGRPSPQQTSTLRTMAVTVQVQVLPEPWRKIRRGLPQTRCLRSNLELLLNSERCTVRLRFPLSMITCYSRHGISLVTPARAHPGVTS
jgi:hypothetical protein